MAQPIQAVQIYFEHPFGAEREVLREFFSFVGCLVKTTMMPVETMLEKHKSLVNPGSERITHTSLTLDISIDGRKAQSCGGLVAMKEEGFTFGLED